MSPNPLPASDASPSDYDVPVNLIYVADPMCSWCYGFAKPMDALLAEPGAAAPVRLELVMGGLRPYTSEPISARMAEEIFGHWRHVHEATGQPFAQAPHTALNQSGFVYDTEPASRATIAVRTHWPKQVWRYFKALQHAFYAEGMNVVHTEVLGGLAEQQGLPRAEFEAAFESTPMREATRADFERSQTWGIRGFPALLSQSGDRLQMVTHGYVPVETLRERLAATRR
jgi:putative protein-disulfide isomerase